MLDEKQKGKKIETKKQLFSRTSPFYSYKVLYTLHLLDEGRGKRRGRQKHPSFFFFSFEVLLDSVNVPLNPPIRSTPVLSFSCSLRLCKCKYSVFFTLVFQILTNMSPTSITHPFIIIIDLNSYTLSSCQCCLSNTSEYGSSHGNIYTLTQV